MQLELKGTPTATICTDEFARMAQFIAKNLGLPGLPFVLIKHPLAGIGENEVKKKGEQIYDEVVEILSSPRDKLESTFRAKEHPLPTGVCPMNTPGI